MRALFLVIALLGGAFATSRQTRPDFNGIWIGDDARNAAAIESGLVLAHERISILQTTNSVVVGPRPIGSNGQSLTVPPNLDTTCSFGGTPAENLRPMLVESCLASWQGDALVMTLETKGATNVPFRINVVTYAIRDGQLKNTRALTVNGELRSTAEFYYSRGKTPPGA